MHAQELKERHRQVMQNMLMDMLRALATPNMDIRKKTLDIALDLINQHNIDEVRPQRPGDTQSPSHLTRAVCPCQQRLEHKTFGPVSALHDRLML